MDRMLFTSLSSIDTNAINRQQLVHELSNLSTVGFKKSYQSVLVSANPKSPGYDTRIHADIRPERVIDDKVLLNGGERLITGRNMDVAMNENTVLGVVTNDGSVAYTRRGDLRVNSNGLLENGAGHIIMGTQGAITLPAGYNLSILSDGTIMASDPSQTSNTAAQAVGRLSLRDATGVDLIRRKDGLFSILNEKSGIGILPDTKNATITPGALEGSNVNAIESMVRLMDDSRSFEQRIRLIKECKEIDESGASMMRISS